MKEERMDFELFKSETCHELKRLGDFDFLETYIQNGDIEKYYELEWYPECLYLLSMVDYISRVNNIPLCNKFSSLRKAKLKKIAYPLGIVTLYSLEKDEKVKENAIKNAIPEFLRHNIVENEVRDVV